MFYIGNYGVTKIDDESLIETNEKTGRRFIVVTEYMYCGAMNNPEDEKETYDYDVYETEKDAAKVLINTLEKRMRDDIFVWEKSIEAVRKQYNLI